jgi:hypothetical protein
MRELVDLVDRVTFPGFRRVTSILSLVGSAAVSCRRTASNREAFAYTYDELRLGLDRAIVTGRAPRRSAALRSGLHRKLFQCLLKCGLVPDVHCSFRTVNLAEKPAQYFSGTDLYESLRAFGHQKSHGLLPFDRPSDLANESIAARGGLANESCVDIACDGNLWLLKR